MCKMVGLLVLALLSSASSAYHVTKDTCVAGGGDGCASEAVTASAMLQVKTKTNTLGSKIDESKHGVHRGPIHIGLDKKTQSLGNKHESHKNPFIGLERINHNTTLVGKAKARFSPQDFADTMTMTALVKIDGLAKGTGALIAYVNSEVRGIQETPTVVPFGPFSGQPQYQITMYTNDGGESVSFKYSDGGTEIDLEETIDLVINDNKGNLVMPIMLTATTPAATYSDSMTMTALVKIHDVVKGSGTLKAYVGTELRGSRSTPTIVPFGPFAFQPQYQIMMYSDTGGETVSFKFDDMPLEETLDFVINDNLGNLVAPIFLTGPGSSAPHAACTDAPQAAVDEYSMSNGWGAGITCEEYHAYNFCNGPTGPAVSELCQATCGLC